jgi:hypothetical protein
VSVLVPCESLKLRRQTLASMRLAKNSAAETVPVTVPK